MFELATIPKLKSGIVLPYFATSRDFNQRNLCAES